MNAVVTAGVQAPTGSAKTARSRVRRVAIASLQAICALALLTMFSITLSAVFVFGVGGAWVASHGHVVRDEPGELVVALDTGKTVSVQSGIPRLAGSAVWVLVSPAGGKTSVIPAQQ